MKSLKYILPALLLMMLTSCGIVQRNGTYSATKTQLNLSMDDLEYLGDSEISVDYRSYLGCFYHIDKINGVEYDGKDRVFTKIAAKELSGKLNRKLSRAAGKVLQDYPEADYFIVVKQTKESDSMFLGASVTVKAVVKAYSLK